MNEIPGAIVTKTRNRNKICDLSSSVNKYSEGLLMSISSEGKYNVMQKPYMGINNGRKTQEITLAT